MTDPEKAELKRLAKDKAFLLFLYQIMRDAGLMSVAAHEGRSLEFVEGRRSLALDILQKIEAAHDNPAPDGIPLFTSIQIFLNVAQSNAKEKPLGRRSDPYRDLSDGDGDSE